MALAGGACIADAARACARARRQCRRRDRAALCRCRLAAGGAPRAARQPADARSRSRSRSLFAVAPLARAGSAIIDADPGRLVDQLPHRVQLSRRCVFLPLAGLVATLADALHAGPARGRRSRPSRAISTPTCSTRRPRRSPAPCARRCIWATASPTCCGRRWWCSRSPIRSSCKEVEKADNAVDELHEAIKLYLVKVSKAEMTRGGKPALRRDPHLHDQSRACRRHHRQEPDGARRQEDQEPLRLLARRA